MVLFEELCAEILEHRRVSFREKTYLAAKNQIRHLLNTFRGRQIESMNRTSWTEHAIRARKETPSRNLNDDRKYFLILMSCAFTKGLIDTPVSKLPKPDMENEIGRELEDEEITRLILATYDPEMRFLIETAIRLGWRKNEMLGCRWDWFNWLNGTIRLPARSTKTKKTRTIPLPPDLLATFRHKYDHRQGPFVFPSPRDLNRPRLLEKAWKHIRRRSGVSCRWHDLRHTCATRMIRAEIPIPHVCKVLGMSQRVLMRIYEHLQVDDLRAATSAVRMPRAANYRKDPP